MPSFIRIMGGGPNESSRGEDSESPLKNYKKLPDTQDIGCWNFFSKWKWCLVLNLTTTREFWANYDLFHPASWKRIFLNFHIFFVSCWISKFALWRCYLNEFVFFFLLCLCFFFVIVFIFVTIFLLIRFCVLITLITIVKGKKSPGSLPKDVSSSLWSNVWKVTGL